MRPVVVSRTLCKTVPVMEHCEEVSTDNYVTHTTLFTNLVVQHREKTKPLTKIKGKEHKNTMSRHSEYSTLSRITHMYNYLA